MTARVLVVDAVPTNRIVLRVKLSAAFYDVVQAASGQAALTMMRKTNPDLVITAHDLPDMSGRSLCAAIRHRAPRNAPATPVVIMHGEDDPGERLASLAAGADDVLTRPIDDLVMLARLRSLLRARDAEAELQLRDDTRRALGLGEASIEFAMPGRVRVISIGAQPDVRAMVNALQKNTTDHIQLVDADDAHKQSRPDPDVIVIAESPNGTGEGLGLLPQLRASRFTRHCSLIYIAHPGQRREAASALDMGANDLMAAGPNPSELAIRLKKQIARKRMNDRLRAQINDGLRAAVVDPLTGLYNRRYTLPHLTRMADRATEHRRAYALLVADLDHFKQVNDVYGHASGDAVLMALADRFRDNLRAADMVARWGGEEFLVAMPDTDRRSAQATAERLCRVMADRPVSLPDGRRITVTLSVGVATWSPGQNEQPLQLVERADEALYAAKNKGRNTVVMADTVTPMQSLRGSKTRPPVPLTAHDKGLGGRQAGYDTGFDTGTDGVTMPPWNQPRG
jgi:two-component system cell cycle response regulator